MKKVACQSEAFPAALDMRIFQDELYQKGDRFIRIIRLDRYEVEFKTTQGDPKGEGEVQVFKKKEFCRLLKNMTLVTAVKPDGAGE